MARWLRNAAACAIVLVAGAAWWALRGERAPVPGEVPATAGRTPEAAAVPYAPAPPEPAAPRDAAEICRRVNLD
jgi:hypothetical protein